jgi:hypothetical protein
VFTMLSRKHPPSVYIINQQLDHDLFNSNDITHNGTKYR